MAWFGFFRDCDLFPTEKKHILELHNHDLYLKRTWGKNNSDYDDSIKWILLFSW